VGKDWFRHHDEMEITLLVAEQQRRDGRDVFCLQAGKRTLGLVPPFHNGRTLPIISVSAIRGGLLDEHGYQTDAMGRERERESQGGSLSLTTTSDENKALRGEAWRQTWGSPIWYGSIMETRDRALNVERWGRP